MRDYLYRGQAINNRQWVYGSLITQDGYYFIFPTAWPHPSEEPLFDHSTGIIDGRLIPVVPETVGQYTNMNDINACMIFEGDILEVIGNIWDNPDIVRN